MSEPTWKRVEPGWYWAEGWGSVVRTDGGWIGSASSYRSVTVPPVVGPYRSMTGAREALVKALRADKSNRHTASQQRLPPWRARS